MAKILRKPRTIRTKHINNNINVNIRSIDNEIFCASLLFYKIETEHDDIMKFFYIGHGYII